MNRSQILRTAEDLISTERDKIYGDPFMNHDRIAKLWSVLLEKEITPSQVALCMVMVKAARLVQTPDHEDSFIDGSAYFAIAGELATGDCE